MDDKQIFSHVDELVAEEHELRAKAQPTDEDRSRLAHIEQDLDQCWDLLRQRRAKREFGDNPDNAHERPENEVESYLQ